MIEQVFLAVVLRVVDGDTFAADVPVWHGLTVSTLVRLNGIDTPELRGKCTAEKEKAEQAKEHLEFMLKSGKVTLHNVQPDKYFGRVVADVKVENLHINESLIANGWAKPYQGGQRQGWCK